MSLLKALVVVSGRIVQLPAADTVADFNTIANKPTTLAGYGIAASNVLATLLTVDGAGSGIDADLLDGNSSAFYQDLGNATGILAPARITDATLTIAKTSGLQAALDAKLNVASPVMTGNPTLNAGTGAHSTFAVNRDAGFVYDMRINTAGALRWLWRYADTT